ncbi:non-ribosomal peptide synthetase [Streptomyces sp. NPDC003023]|uniref:non-ribosomal peptide synthetase n=1 Tax=Streptomyces sp. NPDC003023 TaxID=3364675 RepID=UPI0036B27072
MPASITTQYLERYQRLGTGDAGTILLPVTGAQRRFVLARSLDPAGRPDIVPLFFAFPRGTIDPVRLRTAAQHLAALHPALRSRPSVVRATPVLRVAEPDVPVAEVECAPGEDTTGALRRVLGEWTAKGAPLRLYLARGGRDTEEEVLAVVLDHAACDGQSLALLVEGLGAAYRDDSGPEDVSPADAAAELTAYREAVLLQLDAEHRASSPAALAYWGERLRAVREKAPAPRADLHRAGTPSTGTAETRMPAPGAGAGAGVPFPALLDACRAAAAVLHGTGQVSPIGYPWGGRPAAAAPVLGCFLNTVVHPADTGDAAPDPDATADGWWDDLDRADTPFDEVVHAARSTGSQWSGRLDGLLTVNDARRFPPLRLGGAVGRETHVGGRRIQAPFVVGVDQGTELHVRMAWDRTVVDDRTAEEAFTALRSALPGSALLSSALPTALPTGAPAGT